MEFSRQEYRNGYHSALQGLSLTQELNTGLLYCRQILYHPSHQDELSSMDKRCSNTFNSGAAADPRLRGTSPRHSRSSSVKPDHQAGQTHSLSEQGRLCSPRLGVSQIRKSPSCFLSKLLSTNLLLTACPSLGGFQEFPEVQPLAVLLPSCI